MKWDSEFTPPEPPGVPLEKETPQRRLVGALLIVVTVAVLAVAGLLGWQERAIRSIQAIDARLSNSEDGALSIDRVLLGREGWAYYHVRLLGAPTGRRIDIACEWVDPASIPRDEVEYVTRRVDKTPWPTHCRHRFDFGSTPGTWSVELYIRDRLVSETSFDVVEPGR